MITEFAPAKINLTLHVTGKRPDGYHLLDSLVVFATVGDNITVTPGEGLHLCLTGPFATGLSTEPDNLVLRAARALAEATGHAPYAHITLAKNLPIASGIGGGSADAAATIRALMRLWQVHPDAPTLHALLLRLGADVPVCFASQPTRMGGIGEQLSPAPAIPPCGMLLVNPGVALSTADVFRNRPAGFSLHPALPDAWPTAAAMAADLATCSNDLEPPARALCPPVSGALQALQATQNCLLARMSGSGATCFALYATPEIAHHAATQLPSQNGWRWSGPLFTPTPPLYAAPAAT